MHTTRASRLQRSTSTSVVSVSRVNSWSVLSGGEALVRSVESSRSLLPVAWIRFSVCV